MIEYKIINIEFPHGCNEAQLIELNWIGKRGWKVIKDISHDFGMTKDGYTIVKYLCRRNRISGRILDIIFLKDGNLN